MVKKDKSIKPYLDICVICGEETGNIILTNPINDDDYQKYICNGNVCDECKKHIEKGEVGLIKVASSSTGGIRLGGMSIFISREYAKQICTAEQIKNGFALCDEDAWSRLFGNIEKIEDNETNRNNKAQS